MSRPNDTVASREVLGVLLPRISQSRALISSTFAILRVQPRASPPPFAILRVQPRASPTPFVTEVQEEDVDVVGERLTFKRGFSKYLDAYQWAPKLVVNEVYCTHTALDYSLPWQKQRQFTNYILCSAFMIGDRKLLTNAHCVEHDTQQQRNNDAYGPFPQGELALPLEAYDSPSNAIIIIQQRSPVIKGMMVEFAKNMAGFLAGSGKKHIIVLSSLDFGKWQKVDMPSGLQIYYLSSADSNGTDENCEQLGWKKLQEYDHSQKHWKYLSDLVEGNATLEDIISVEDDLEEENYYASLPFAALFSFLKAKGLKVTCLLCYCSKGDNILDAFQLADAVCKLHWLSHPTIGIEGDKWRVPLSWMSRIWTTPDLSIF
ncbi:hypothetical protein Fmac_002540 [Flemingia macrophylla]|uniref:Peptidase S1 domain-containing protein n=1 Tax=Flemingia macrophylla TaxID=520843 RepID=A0ABD1NK67_9FABA